MIVSRAWQRKKQRTHNIIKVNSNTNTVVCDKATTEHVIVNMTCNSAPCSNGALIRNRTPSASTISSGAIPMDIFAGSSMTGDGFVLGSGVGKNGSNAPRGILQLKAFQKYAVQFIVRSFLTSANYILLSAI